MKQQLNAELKPIVDKILSGDVLNLPLLHRAEFEQISTYCLGILKEEIDDTRKQLEDLIDELTDEPEIELAPPSRGKKKK